MRKLTSEELEKFLELTNAADLANKEQAVFFSRLRQLYKVPVGYLIDCTTGEWHPPIP